MVADPCLGAQLTPSFVAGELSWKDWSLGVWKPEDPEWWRVRWPRGPLGRVPWEKAAFCRLCGMWVGERGAEPEYKSVMAVLVEPLELEESPEEKESERSLW